MNLPAVLTEYLAELAHRTRTAVGDDLLGMWVIGSAAVGGYDHGISDVDVLAVSRHRWRPDDRQRLGEQVVHPTLSCPTAGLEFVWYALPNLVELGDPVQFQLNVNGGPDRARMIQVEPDASPNYWSVLDLAAARRVGVPLGSDADAAAVLPEVPRDRVVRAARGSLEWHDGPDAGSPNRVLNLARLLVLLEEGRWLSKQGGGEALRASHPELAPAVDEALRARAEKRWMDPALAAPLSASVLRALG